jgi:hypothetical protein
MIHCLENDGLYEELAFVRLGVDLALRGKDLLSIKWSQVNFPFVSDICISKLSRVCSPMKISQDTMDALNNLQHGKSELIFNKPSVQYIKNIQKSIGDSEFKLYFLRHIGLVLNN